MIEETALTDSDLKKFARSVASLTPKNTKLDVVVMALPKAITETFPPPQGMTEHGFSLELKKASFVSSPSIFVFTMFCMSTNVLQSSKDIL